MVSQRSKVVTIDGNAASNTNTNTNTMSLSNNNGYRPIPLPASSSSPPSYSSLGAHHNNSSSAQAQLFNPRLILSQIIALQSFHYVVLGIIFQVNHVLFATSITLDRIFTSKYLDIWSALGWIDNAAVLMSSVIGSLLLAIIVEKSKKCLDFSVTLFLIHIILCSIYDGCPSTWDWWIVHILGMILMVILGEYCCSKRELSDIPLLVL
ncbi:hypothetical protein ACHAWU_005213 [Discostella pseudostelligera]|uniref:Protein SYS1 homolog n=1 Tax=Discostella pseudostelligera TaxID=259834 RepID=A0ABD3MGN7_9STRA